MASNQNSTSTVRPLIIVGHGSRSLEAVAIFEQVVAMAALRWDGPVRGAHMELAEPSIECVVAELAALGHADFAVVPYFLYHGVHIQEDIPGILAKIQEEQPGLRFTLGKPLGADPRIVDVLISNALQIEA